MKQKRQRILILAVVLVMSLFVVDMLVLEPFLDMRADMVKHRNDVTRRLADAKRTLELEKQYLPMRDRVNESASSDASTVENQLLHQMHDWQQRAGVNNASFQRSHSIDAHGFTCLTFNVSASGTMLSVAGLMYELETAGIPLRVEDLRVAPVKHDGADELQLRMNVTTLCRQTKTAPGTPVAATADMGGGTP